MSAATPDVFTVPEAARYLRVGPRILRKLLPKIQHRKIDGRGTIRIHRSALDAYLLGQKNSASSTTPLLKEPA